MQLQGVDLNLLVVLEALLGERSVTRARRAAGADGLGDRPTRWRACARPSATSCWSAPRGMVPTVRGEQLLAPLRAALRDVGTLLSGPLRFDPRTSRREVRARQHRLHRGGAAAAAARPRVGGGAAVQLRVRPLEPDVAGPLGQRRAPRSRSGWCSTTASGCSSRRCSPRRWCWCAARAIRRSGAASTWRPTCACATCSSACAARTRAWSTSGWRSSATRGRSRWSCRTSSRRR